MTSEAGPTACYVYVTLPGRTTAVTAGRFDLTEGQRGTYAGRFVYGRSYRERRDAVELDPSELKLAPGTFATMGVFGALRDAGPGRWGRRLIERQGGRPNEIDYLLNSPDDRAGALGFGLEPKPPAPRRPFARTQDLEKLQALADAVVNEENLPFDEAAAQAEESPLLGTSMGGARPKAVVEDDDGLWIAKFNRPDDLWNRARVERAMLLLGRECGLTTAESKAVSVAGRDALLVKRFDREPSESGYLRARMASGSTLLRAGAPREHWSYMLLAEEIRRVCGNPKRQAEELFRRMCFNALISNFGDHPRKNAILAMNRDWELSPAYGLAPSARPERREFALICGDKGCRADRGNILSQCERFLLDRRQAEAIATEMETTVRNGWHRIARSEGVAERDCDAIRGAFAHPDFG